MLYNCIQKKSITLPRGIYNYHSKLVLVVAILFFFSSNSSSYVCTLGALVMRLDTNFLMIFFFFVFSNPNKKNIPEYLPHLRIRHRHYFHRLSSQEVDLRLMKYLRRPFWY